MKKGDVITLTQLEVDLAIVWGYMREANARAIGARATPIGPQDQLSHDIGGALGELAFCKGINAYPGLHPNEVDRHDVVLPNGVTVDVKHSYGVDRDGGPRRTRLLVRVIEIVLTEKRCDWYVLMVGQPPRLTYWGKMAADELLVDGRIDKTLPSPAYAAEIKDLK